MNGTDVMPGARVVTTEVGLEMVVPDSLEVVTTFVLLEQGRWFEDEVPFVRGLLEPGDIVADVGANFGAYTLEAARIVGAEGRVVAFEPARDTADHLRASIARNGTPQVAVHQVALGAERGEAQLALGPSPELAQLGAEGPSEEVPVELLSDHAEALGGMAFLKLDAEGTEEAIVRASADMLRREGPLVMFELRHGAQVNEGLLQAMTDLGFSLYELCPALDALVPFSPSRVDGFRLNLFAAPTARAAQLVARGKLIEPGQPRRSSPEAVSRWAESRRLLRAAGATASTEILALWRAAHDPSVSLPDRYASLCAAFALGPGPDLAQRLTFARVALELGQRVAALDAVIPLFEETLRTPAAAFACPIAEYEEDEVFDPSRIGRAQIIETRLRYGAFSSFYEPQDVFELLDQYRDAGGNAPDIARRRSLLERKWTPHRPAS